MKNATCLLVLMLSGCGTYVPKISEVASDQVYSFDVHYSVFCEAIEAIHKASEKSEELKAITGLENDFFKDWGLLYSVSLSVTENSNVDPALIAGSIHPGSVVFTLNAGLGFSARAKREQTSQVFASVERLRSLNKCEEGSTANRLVVSGGNLGLSNWLIGELSTVESGIFSSVESKEPFTYTVTFDIGRSSSVNPQWAFTNSRTRNASGVFGATRTTSHSVLFTFGPADKKRKKLEENALSVHNSRLVAEAVARQ